MFRFNFDLDEVLNEGSNLTGTSKDEPNGNQNSKPCRQHKLEDLIKRLPPAISYSPITIPILSPSEAIDSSKTFLRRDLFDVRFQLIANDEEEQEEGSQKTSERQNDDNNPVFSVDSDLSAGLYEGGLKSWECGIDLAGWVVDQERLPFRELIGKRILELGCGAAFPACSLLYRLLSSAFPDNETREPSSIELQDFNEEVLSLITLPNLLLAYHLSTLSKDESENLSAGELSISPDFIGCFLSALSDRNIQLNFFSGSWDSFDCDFRDNRSVDDCTAARYNIVLTSETIYSLDTLPSLVSLLARACISSDPDEDSGKCLVAAKRLYFGLGGGEVEFKKLVENGNILENTDQAKKKQKLKGTVEVIWESDEGRKGRVGGVERIIMDVNRWKQIIQEN